MPTEKTRQADNVLSTSSHDGGATGLPLDRNEVERRAFMESLPYRQAFDRIRAEYLEMPGMRLTAAQIQRLSGVHISICALVLDDLVRVHFLHKELDGSYARRSDGGGPVQSRMARAEANASPVRSTSRRRG